MKLGNSVSPLRDRITEWGVRLLAHQTGSGLILSEEAGAKLGDKRVGDKIP